MGYTTDFEGSFKLDKPLAPEHLEYLKLFAQTRRMARDADIAAGMPDPVRIAAGLPIGDQGGYYIGDTEDYGQTDDASVLHYNDPPEAQPGLWCQWVPVGGGTLIEWDGNEKFYYYTQWIIYIIIHFLEPWGYVLSGEVRWWGEESTDLGMIEVVNNKVTEKFGRVIYEEHPEG